MKPRYFYPNENDKIEFTKEEIEKLLNEVYKDGYDDANLQQIRYYPIWTQPYYVSTTPYITVSTTDSTTKTVPEFTPCWCIGDPLKTSIEV